MKILPAKPPQLPVERIEELIGGKNSLGLSLSLPDGTGAAVGVLAVRGYNRNELGRLGVNDCNVYDDAIFLVVRGPAGLTVHRFNGNVDPARIGWNAAIGKPFAQLKAGLWYFVKGPHKRLARAFRQASDDPSDPTFAGKFGIPNHGWFTVIRNDGKGHTFEDCGYHAINVHPGSEVGTSSWGCQTLPPKGQWPLFQTTAYAALSAAKQRVLPWLLIEDKVA